MISRPKPAAIEPTAVDVDCLNTRDITLSDSRVAHAESIETESRHAKRLPTHVHLFQSS